MVVASCLEYRRVELTVAEMLDHGYTDVQWLVVGH